MVFDADCCYWRITVIQNPEHVSCCKYPKSFACLSTSGFMPQTHFAATSAGQRIRGVWSHLKTSLAIKLALTSFIQSQITVSFFYAKW